MKIKFLYNLNQDIINYLIINKTLLKGSESKVLELYYKKFGNNLKKKQLKKFINNLLLFNKINIEEKIIEIKNDWEKIESIFLERMNNIFKTNLKLNKIKIYLTTNDRCSYYFKKKMFFVSVFSSKPRLIIMHELFHFFTIQCFKKQLKKLTQKEAYDIKESLVELLNIEFKDLLNRPDKGYSRHQKLRSLVKKSWNKKKDIYDTFKNAINFTKNKNF